MPTRTPCKITINAANVTWTNMPVALTELFGNVHRRLLVDLTDVDKIRLSARVSTVGAASAFIRAEYSTDESVWSNLTGNTLGLNGSPSTRATAWEAIPAGAKGSVFVRIVGSGGDGALDPVLGTIMLEAR